MFYLNACIGNISHISQTFVIRKNELEWSLTVLNFSFSLIVISMLRSQLDWELSSIWASTFTRVLIEQLWKLVVECRMKSRHIWMVGLLVQQKLAGRSLNSTCMESYQLFNYHKWPLTNLWLVDLIFKRLKKAKFRQAAKMLLSLRSSPQTMNPYI